MKNIFRGRKTWNKRQDCKERNDKETLNQIENNKTGQNNISWEIRANHRGNKKSRGEFEIKYKVENDSLLFRGQTYKGRRH